MVVCRRILETNREFNKDRNPFYRVGKVSARRILQEPFYMNPDHPDMIVLLRLFSFILFMVVHSFSFLCKRQDGFLGVKG